MINRCSVSRTPQWCSQDKKWIFVLLPMCLSPDWLPRASVCRYLVQLRVWQQTLWQLVRRQPWRRAPRRLCAHAQWTASRCHRCCLWSELDRCCPPRPDARCIFYLTAHQCWTPPRQPLVRGLLSQFEQVCRLFLTCKSQSNQWQHLRV